MKTIALLILLLASGCVTIDIGGIIDAVKPPVVEPAKPSLPTNPSTPPDLEGSISEQWSFAKKDYDQTWRVRWPSSLPVGEYCTVNGVRADFRSFDTDHGARRPSYTMPQSVAVTYPATCILYDKDEPVAWFVANSQNESGRLP